MEKVYPNGVLIRRTISNSSACVIDLQLQLVPVVAVEKPIVANDRLVRRHTDLKQSANWFVSVVIGSQMIKACQTEGYILYSPTDGYLEFLGWIER